MVTYRQAEEKDYQKINNFHNRIYSSNRTIEQFYWEFHNAPAGKSIYIIGEDEGKIVGTNCVIPFELVKYNHEKVLTGKSEDTLVDPEYRGQNIFYNLYQVLFDKCRENNIKVIWGFTSASKPFKKLGFDIPYEHLQIMEVNKIFASYKFLSQLNNKNKTIDKAKILALCVYSKLRHLYKILDSSALKDFNISTAPQFDQVSDLTGANLNSTDKSFAIDQSPEFQKWRIYSNPNYQNIHTFSFSKKDKKLVGLIVFQSSPGKPAYICQSTFHPELSKKVVVQMIQYATKKVFMEGIFLIRNWVFNHNSYNKKEIELYDAAKYTILKRGIGLVWKELQTSGLESGGFNLSRIATQGVS